jgi:hypothetical protein
MPQEELIHIRRGSLRRYIRECQKRKVTGKIVVVQDLKLITGGSN